MQGSLIQTPLQEVLQFISMANNSGVLTIRDRMGGETKLTIHKSKVVNSSSLDRRRRLGELLVQRGLVRRSELAHLLKLQRTVESDKRLGQLLAERDIVPRDVVDDVLRAQVEEEIWALFGLEDGDFNYQAIEDSAVGESFVRIEIGPLLIEGTRRLDEWRNIIKKLPHDQLLIGLTETGRQLIEADEAPKFDQQQWRVLAQVNGRFSIRAIINRSFIGRFHVFHILSGFLDDGLIEIRQPLVGTEGEDPNPLKVRQSASSGSIQLSNRGISGIFSRLTGTAKKDEAVENLQFITPVGSLGFTVQRLAEKLLAGNGSASEPTLEAFWVEILPQFTRADLLEVEGNSIRTERLEAFFRAFEFSNAVVMTYEDAIEAILLMMDATYRHGVTRLGEKAAARATRELLDDIIPRIQHTYANDFKFGEQVQNILRIAA